MSGISGFIGHIGRGNYKSFDTNQPKEVESRSTYSTNNNAYQFTLTKSIEDLINNKEEEQQEIEFTFEDKQNGSKRTFKYSFKKDSPFGQKLHSGELDKRALEILLIKRLALLVQIKITAANEFESIGVDYGPDQAKIMASYRDEKDEKIEIKPTIRKLNGKEVDLSKHLLIKDKQKKVLDNIKRDFTPVSLKEQPSPEASQPSVKTYTTPQSNSEVKSFSTPTVPQQSKPDFKSKIQNLKKFKSITEIEFDEKADSISFQTKSVEDTTAFLSELFGLNLESDEEFQNEIKQITGQLDHCEVSLKPPKIQFQSANHHLKKIDLSQKLNRPTFNKAHENQVKLRYPGSTELYPPDKSLVSIGNEPNNETSRDSFINASKVTHPSSSLNLIATQGPTENTIFDFFQLAYEQGSENTKKEVSIIRLTDAYEKKGRAYKEKCFPYWKFEFFSDPQSINSLLPNDIPEDRKDILENFKRQIQQLKSKIDKQNKTITFENNGDTYTLKFEEDKIKIKKGDQEEVIINLKSAKVGDFSIPETVEDKQAFFDMVNTERKSKIPLIVHCSAGVGRTGMLSVCCEAFNYIDQEVGNLNDNIEQQIKWLENPQINIPATILKQRVDRPGFVQTNDQVNFIYEMVAKYVDEKKERYQQIKKSTEEKGEIEKQLNDQKAKSSSTHKKNPKGILKKGVAQNKTELRVHFSETKDWDKFLKVEKYQMETDFSDELEKKRTDIKNNNKAKESEYETSNIDSFKTDVEALLGNIEILEATEKYVKNQEIENIKSELENINKELLNIKPNRLLKKTTSIFQLETEVEKTNEIKKRANIDEIFTEKIQNIEKKLNNIPEYKRCLFHIMHIESENKLKNIDAFLKANPNKMAREEAKKLRKELNAIFKQSSDKIFDKMEVIRHDIFSLEAMSINNLLKKEKSQCNKKLDKLWTLSKEKRLTENETNQFTELDSRYQQCKSMIKLTTQKVEEKIKLVKELREITRAASKLLKRFH